MSNWKLVKLNFGKSPAHFGELGIGIEETSERVRSDTLFSAWISAYARLFGKDNVEELLKQFLHSSPLVRMSSTFIYQQDGERTIYYLPRPLKFPLNYPDADDLAFFKTYKKLKYLPLEIWQRWYQGEGFIDGDKQELIAETKGKSNGYLQQAGAFDYGKAYKIDKHPKVAIDRITRATNFYHTGFVQFKSEAKSQSGLYFLLYFDKEDKQLENNLHAALNFLAEEGIGGERSSGFGRFNIAEWSTINKDDKLTKLWWDVTHFYQGNSHCLLSLFWDDNPEKLQQLITEKASYEIQECGGWLAESNQRRKMVRMFAEGSVFPEKPEGKLVDVTPQELRTKDGGYKTHPIYRSGISLSLPIQVQNQ